MPNSGALTGFSSQDPPSLLHRARISHGPLPLPHALHARSQPASLERLTAVNPEYSRDRQTAAAASRCADHHSASALRGERGTPTCADALCVAGVRLCRVACVRLCRAAPVRYRGLNVKVDQGVSDNEITDRKNMFGINKVGVRACVRGRLCGCGRPSLSLSPEPQDPL